MICATLNIAALCASLLLHVGRFIPQQTAYWYWLAFSLHVYYLLANLAIFAAQITRIEYFYWPLSCTLSAILPPAYAVLINYTLIGLFGSRSAPLGSYLAAAERGRPPSTGELLFNWLVAGLLTRMLFIVYCAQRKLEKENEKCGAEQEEVLSCCCFRVEIKKAARISAWTNIVFLLCVLAFCSSLASEPGFEVAIGSEVLLIAVSVPILLTKRCPKSILCWPFVFVMKPLIVLMNAFSFVCLPIIYAADRGELVRWLKKLNQGGTVETEPTVGHLVGMMAFTVLYTGHFGIIYRGQRRMAREKHLREQRTRGEIQPMLS